VAYSGRFKPKNRQKYAGNPDQIIWRSSWELKLMRELDEHPDVLKWASEEMTIQYHDPVKKKNRRYFPDFVIKRRGANGKIEVIMIEVKPKSQSQPPVLKEGKKPTKRYYAGLATWMTNEAKWAAAKAFCAKKGWIFQVMNERDLGIKF
jgi:hypothetical protein